MSRGDYATACQKFAASHKLDPGVGTSLNLADCYEKSGRTASAWAEFRDAAAAARRAGSKEREQVARTRADSLEKNLARLTIIERIAHHEQQISRDGAVIDRAVLGTAVPVDPGDHLVEVSAPGKKKWSKPVDVRPGAQIVVELPELEAETQTAGAAGAAPSSDYAGSSSSKGGTQKVVALVAGGVGVVGLVVGTVFGLQATSKWSDAKGRCANPPSGCDDEGVRLGDDARSAATLSTVGFAVGAVGVAAGTILWLTAPSPSRDLRGSAATSIGVGFDGQKFLLRGSF